MGEVILRINEQNVKLNVSLVFYGRNPMTKRYMVCISDQAVGKQVRLFCEDPFDQNEANALVQKIREGKISDLTGYLAEWNF